MHCDQIWTNATLWLTGPQPHLLTNGMIASRAGRIVYAGPVQDGYTANQTEDVEGRLITPGLIDPHTHLVFGGDRSNEFRLRLEGQSYEDIARQGGGIISTMRATRAASEDELVAQTLPRLDALLAEGVTTVEIKSGYGLTLGDELKMLRAARTLGALRPVRVTKTFLGAHTLPPEFAGRSDDYISEVCERMIPAVAAEKLAEAVDVFCEGIGFSLAQTTRVFDAARAHGLKVKVHAEQLSNLNGAALAARYDALSADHLEHLDDGGVAALRASGTVATLLPGAFYYIRETKLPPVSALRKAQVPMALATDCNPGTSPLTSLLLTMNMAATLFRMTVDECLLGVTLNAARALGLSHEIGSLETGKACDLNIWDASAPEHLVYRMGFNPLYARIFNGVPQ